MGKKGKKKDFSIKEKELLEIENLKLQKREKQASIIHHSNHDCVSDYGNSEMVRFD